MITKKNWYGSYYRRGGIWTDKHKNRYNTPVTYRQVETGRILNSKKQLIGMESPRQHYYGYDPTKAKLLKIKRKNAIILVRANKIGSLKHRSSHHRSR